MVDEEGVGVELRGESGVFGPGEVPVGRYTVWMRGKRTEAVVVVREGQVTTVACNRLQYRCEVF